MVSKEDLKNIKKLREFLRSEKMNTTLNKLAMNDYDGTAIRCNREECLYNNNDGECDADTWIELDKKSVCTTYEKFDDEERYEKLQ